MLPVLNRPVIDYIVQDCIAAGIIDFYFVVGEECQQLRTFYDRNFLLEAHLREHSKLDMISSVQPPAGCNFHYIVQPGVGAYGTSVPVYLAREVIGQNEKVLVIMGDQFLFHADGGSEAAHFLQAAQAADTDSAMLALEVPHEEVYKYGIIATQPHGEFELFESIVEKPRVEDAPTNLNNASFYLFDKTFFEVLEEDMQRPRTGEYFITDPLNTYVQRGSSIAVVRSTGEYLDCGTVAGWLHANAVVARNQRS